MKKLICLVVTIVMLCSCQPKNDTIEGFVPYSYIIYFGDTIPTSNTIVFYHIQTDSNGDYIFNFDAIIINDNILKYIPTDELMHELKFRNHNKSIPQPENNTTTIITVVEN